MIQEWKLLLTEKTKLVVKKALKDKGYHIGAGMLAKQWIYYVPIKKSLGGSGDWTWCIDKDGSHKEYDYVQEISFEQFMCEFIKDPKYIGYEIY